MFDPRGMGYSTQIRCFPSEAGENALLGNLPPFPVGKTQQAAYEKAYATLDDRCARDGGPLLDHDSSADIARDMNLLREAVGDPVLNYYGQSYGTLLGARSTARARNRLPAGHQPVPHPVTRSRLYMRTRRARSSLRPGRYSVGLVCANKRRCRARSRRLRSGRWRA